MSRKIIRQGCLPEPGTFRFHCWKCGTIWESDEGEAIYYFLEKYDYNHKPIKPLQMSEKCPVCKELITSSDRKKEAEE